MSSFIEKNKQSEFSQICKDHGRKVTPRLLTKLYLFIEAESAGNIKILEKLTEKFPIIYTIYMRMCGSYYISIDVEDTYVDDPYNAEPFSELRIIKYKKCKKKYSRDIESITDLPYELFELKGQLMLIKSKVICFDPLDIGKTINRVIKKMEDNIIGMHLIEKILEYAGPPLQKKMNLTYTKLRPTQITARSLWTDDEDSYYFEFETSMYDELIMMNIIHYNPGVIHSLVKKFPEAMMHLSKYC